VIVGDTVRCPWHHACFSLRNGEALRAPALSPVPRWETQRRGDTVVVTKKIERDPLATSYPVRVDRSRLPREIVIVGAGAAGSAAAEMLRRCAFAGRITVVDEDSLAPYDRPNLSKDYLAGNAPEEWIPLRPHGFYAQHDIHIVHCAATGIDVAEKRLIVDGRIRLPTTRFCSRRGPRRCISSFRARRSTRTCITCARSRTAATSSPTPSSPDARW
jgi:hypothetical protein